MGIRGRVRGLGGGLELALGGRGRAGGRVRVGR